MHEEPRHVLVLNDQYPFSAHLPNLGDRALQEGFRVLCRTLSGVRIQSGRWKAFPYLTDRRFEASEPPRAALNRWHHHVAGYGLRRVALESRLARLFASGALGRLELPWLDRRARLHTGLGLVAAMEPLLLRAYHAARLRSQIAAANLVVFNAGGLIADHLGRYLPERLFELDLAVRMGKITAVVNCSVALSQPRNLALAGEVLRAVDMHVVREPLSAARLVELGVPADRIIVSVDAAFAIDVPPSPSVAARGADIGVMVRGDRPVDLGVWSRFVDRLRDRTGARIHYIPGCHKHDPPVRRGLAARCRLDDDGTMPGLDEAIERIGRLRLLVTDRYHGCVFAMRTGTPMIPVRSTTHKTEGLLRALPYPVPVQPPLDASLVETYLQHAVDALADGAALSARLAAIDAEARARLNADYRRLFLHLGIARLPESS